MLGIPTCCQKAFTGQLPGVRIQAASLKKTFLMYWLAREQSRVVGGWTSKRGTHRTLEPRHAADVSGALEQDDIGEGLVGDGGHGMCHPPLQRRAGAAASGEKCRPKMQGQPSSNFSRARTDRRAKFNEEKVRSLWLISGQNLKP